MKFSKNITLVLVSFVTIISSAFSQKEVPNYILAENANPVVYVMSFINFGSQKSLRKVNKYDESINIDDFTNMDEALWAEVIRVIDQTLKSTGIHAKGFVSMDMAEMMKNPDASKDMGKEEFLEVKPYYVLALTIMDDGKLKKRFEKNKALTAGDIKTGGGLTIQLAGATSSSSAFSIRKMNASVDGIIGLLQKEIDAKPDSYFLKQIDQQEKEKSDKIVENSANQGNSWLEIEEVSAEEKAYPKDITGKPILVTHLYTVEGMPKGAAKRNTENIAKLKGYLDKLYPGKYKLVHASNCGDELSSGEYKFVLHCFSKTSYKVKISENQTTGLEQRSGGLSSAFTYSLKDIETNVLYRGPEDSKFKAKASTDQPYALRYALKAFNRYYSWSE